MSLAADLVMPQIQWSLQRMHDISMNILKILINIRASPYWGLSNSSLVSRKSFKRNNEMCAGEEFMKRMKNKILLTIYKEFFLTQDKWKTKKFLRQSGLFRKEQSIRAHFPNAQRT